MPNEMSCNEKMRKAYVEMQIVVMKSMGELRLRTELC